MTTPADTGWILAVDDSDCDVMLLRLALQNWTSLDRIRWVSDGEQAIQLLAELVRKGQQNLPDTVVLDLNLPRVDGYGILSYIRSNQALEQIAVLVYTSSDSDTERRKLYEQGADGYFPKPSDLTAYGRLPDAIQQARRYRSERMKRKQASQASSWH